MWDKENRTSPEAAPLLTLAIAWNLVLHTPRGELIRKGIRIGDRDSIIDHAWAISGLYVDYLGAVDFAGSDYTP